MKKAMFMAAVAGLIALPAMAVVPPTLNISLGVRETGSTAPLGQPGGTSGSLEWVDKDGQQLVLDGTWQQFTWDLDVAPISAFTGNGVLDGTAGTIEHLRINKGNNGFGGTYNISVDDLTISTDASAAPPPPIVTTIQDWEGLVDGDEATFQEPGFSGSTAGNLAASPNFAGVDSSIAHSGLASYNAQWKFSNLASSSWVRFTTFSDVIGLNGGDPTIAFDQNAIVSVWIRGVPEPGSLALLGLSSLVFVRRRR